jgi:hypothetical protein
MSVTVTVMDTKDKGLGTFVGDIRNGQATITKWTDKAGLQADKPYKLKANGKVYNATWRAVGHFDHVS